MYIMSVSERVYLVCECVYVCLNVYGCILLCMSVSVLYVFVCLLIPVSVFMAASGFIYLYVYVSIYFVSLTVFFMYSNNKQS